MSASSVLSVIAPVVGAASAPLGAESQDVSGEFAAVLSEAGEETAAPSPEATPSASASPASKTQTPKTAPAAAFVLALEDGVSDATSLATPAAPAAPVPVAETRPAAVAQEDAVPAEKTESAPDADPAAAVPVAVAPTPVGVQIPTIPAGPPPQAAAETALDQNGAPAAPPPASDASDVPADAKAATPGANATAAKTAEAPTATPVTPQPLKAEPLRATTASRDPRPLEASAETAVSVADAMKAEPAKAGAPAPQDPQAARASGPTAPSPLPAAAKALETVSAPRLDPAAFNAPPAETAPAAQPPASAPAIAASTLSRATIETTVHIAAQIAHRLEGKQTRFDMVLTPEELGRVEVSLDIDADGRLAARLAFDNPAAAADLRGRADELRRQLIDAGFQLTGDSLEFSERDANAFSGGGFDRGQDRAFSFAGGKRLGDQADQAVAARPAAWINLSLTPDRVDMRV